MGMAVAVVVQADEIADFPEESASVQYCTKTNSLDLVVSSAASFSISAASILVAIALFAH